MRPFRFLVPLLVGLLLALPAAAFPWSNKSAFAHTRQVEIVHLANDSTTTYASAVSITSAVVGTTITLSRNLSPQTSGSNLVLTVNDNAGGDLVVTFRATCRDQFWTQTTQDFTSTGSVTTLGTKICAKVESLVVRSITNAAASDTVSLGVGDVVGLPFMFSKDLHEVKNASLSAAAGASVTAITINTTNLDNINFACKASCFTGSDVVAGDNLHFLLLTDEDTPDDRTTPYR